MGRRASPGALPAISEDEPLQQSPTSPTAPIYAPPIPARALNRPQREYLWGLSHPARVESPPQYLNIADAEGPKGEKLADVRRAIANNKHLAKRGGFKTLTLLILLAVLCIAGLVVGLVVGLRNAHKYEIPALYRRVQLIQTVGKAPMALEIPMVVRQELYQMPMEVQTRLSHPVHIP